MVTKCVISFDLGGSFNLAQRMSFERNVQPLKRFKQLSTTHHIHYHEDVYEIHLFRLIYRIVNKKMMIVSKRKKNRKQKLMSNKKLNSASLLKHRIGLFKYNNQQVFRQHLRQDRKKHVEFITYNVLFN